MAARLIRLTGQAAVVVQSERDSASRYLNGEALMPYRLRMTVSNPGRQPKRIVIYGGTVFEVQDPMSRVQNLVASAQTVVTVSPGQSQAIEIDTWCLNQSYSPPHNTAMRPTVLATSQRYSDQHELWNEMNQRR